MRSPFIIIDWEGGIIERVSLWRWIEFIFFTTPEQIADDYRIPGMSYKPPGAPKGFAGIGYKDVFGYDFILAARRKTYRKAHSLGYGMHKGWNCNPWRRLDLRAKVI